MENAQQWKKSSRGFTLIEIALVISVLILLLALTIPAFRAFERTSRLESDAQEIAEILRSAQSRTLAAQDDTRYGVYFDDMTVPHQYTLFQTDTNYASRVVSEDQIFQISSTLIFSTLALGGAGGQEVVFDRIEGTTSQGGYLMLRTAQGPVEQQEITVEGSGNIQIAEAESLSDSNRIKDTRHVHIDYEGRTINTMTENILLDFNSGAQVEVLPIIDNLSGGQFFWTGTVSVAGVDQQLTVQTHTLNAGALNDETTFSVHRDLRFNTERVAVRVDGDVSGTPAGKVVEYDGGINNGQLMSGGYSGFVVNPPGPTQQ